MQNDWSELQKRGHLGKCYDSPINGCPKRWNHCGGRGVLSCCCLRKLRDLPFVRSREKAYLKSRLLELLTCMHEQNDSPADTSNLFCFFVSLLFDGIWFLHPGLYWGCNCNL